MKLKSAELITAHKFSAISNPTRIIDVNNVTDLAFDPSMRLVCFTLKGEAMGVPCERIARMTFDLDEPKAAKKAPAKKAE